MHLCYRSRQALGKQTQRRRATHFLPPAFPMRYHRFHQARRLRHLRHPCAMRRTCRTTRTAPATRVVATPAWAAIARRRRAYARAPHARIQSQEARLIALLDDALCHHHRSRTYRRHRLRLLLCHRGHRLRRPSRPRRLRTRHILPRRRLRHRHRPHHLGLTNHLPLHLPSAASVASTPR